jgi:D-threo-aldose 1-dehydrogenase
MGDALRRHCRDDFVLSTKVGCLLRATPETPGPDDEFPSALPFAARYDYSYDAVMRSVEDSLQRLALNRIDILLMHDVDARAHGTKAGEVFRAAMEGGYRALDTLRGEGGIGAVGLGVNEWEICAEAMRQGDFDCFLVGGRYTLLEQSAVETMLPECERHGVSMIVGGPFNSGILATGAAGAGCYDYASPPPKVVATVRCIEAVCEAHAVPLAAAALQFPLGHPAVAAVVPGARSATEVHQNLALFQTAIPDGLWSDLKREGLLHADAPTPAS